jgi:hypothetical protein
LQPISASFVCIGKRPTHQCLQMIRFRLCQEPERLARAIREGIVDRAVGALAQAGETIVRRRGDRA